MKHEMNKRTKRRSHVSNAKYSQQRRNIKKILVKQNGSKCGYCFKKVYSLKELSIDHIVPLSKGGADKIWNMLLSCIPCNQEKADMNIEDWLKKIGWESEL